MRQVAGVGAVGGPSEAVVAGGIVSDCSEVGGKGAQKDWVRLSRTVCLPAWKNDNASSVHLAEAS